MKTVAVLVSFLGLSILRAANPALGMAEHGQFKKIGEKVVFVTDTKRNAHRKKNSGLDSLKQWLVIGAELQTLKPHRPNERIVTGGVGHFNIGMLGPYAGIPIFIAHGDNRPTFVGMTDANGKFAVKLPQVEDTSEIYLFFSGAIDIVKKPYSDNKRNFSFPDGKVLDSYEKLVLRIGSSTERFRVSLPKAEQNGTNQPTSKPKGKEESKSESKAPPVVKVVKLGNWRPSPKHKKMNSSEIGLTLEDAVRVLGPWDKVGDLMSDTKERLYPFSNRNGFNYIIRIGENNSINGVWRESSKFDR